ncbi:MAG: hypothetical protein PHS44_06590 [Candidatus Dojkabacteria bacterium]|nr:hypothetical protein [Candidatus Dojkabacteria bacterium]
MEQPWFNEMLDSQLGSREVRIDRVEGVLTVEICGGILAIGDGDRPEFGVDCQYPSEMLLLREALMRNPDMRSAILRMANQWLDYFGRALETVRTEDITGVSIVKFINSLEPVSTQPPWLYDYIVGVSRAVAVGSMLDSLQASLSQEAAGLLVRFLEVLSIEADFMLADNYSRAQFGASIPKYAWIWSWSLLDYNSRVVDLLVDRGSSIDMAFIQNLRLQVLVEQRAYLDKWGISLSNVIEAIGSPGGSGTTTLATMLLLAKRIGVRILPAGDIGSLLREERRAASVGHRAPLSWDDLLELDPQGRRMLLRSRYSDQNARAVAARLHTDIQIGRLLNDVNPGQSVLFSDCGWLASEIQLAVMSCIAAHAGILEASSRGILLEENEELGARNPWLDDLQLLDLLRTEPIIGTGLRYLRVYAWQFVQQSGILSRLSHLVGPAIGILLDYPTVQIASRISKDPNTNRRVFRSKFSDGNYLEYLRWVSLAVHELLPGTVLRVPCTHKATSRFIQQGLSDSRESGMIDRLLRLRGQHDGQNMILGPRSEALNLIQHTPLQILMGVFIARARAGILNSYKFNYGQRTSDAEFAGETSGILRELLRYIKEAAVSFEEINQQVAQLQDEGDGISFEQKVRNLALEMGCVIP